MEKFRLLAAVIAAHPEGTLIGRTRLQKTVRLLQRLGYPSSYRFSNHFYGPYSEGIQADIDLLERLRLITEEESRTGEGAPYYVFKAAESARDDAVTKQFKKHIDVLSKKDAVVLELAATYDAFREQGLNHTAAVEALRKKKTSKCDNGREEEALVLVKELGLQAI